MRHKRPCSKKKKKKSKTSNRIRQFLQIFAYRRECVTTGIMTGDAKNEGMQHL